MAQTHAQYRKYGTQFPYHILTHARIGRLSGAGRYDDALRRKERELGLSERPDVTDEDAAAINERLALLEKGEEVSIIYYCAGEYETAEGIVRSVDTAFRRIALEEADDGQGSQTVKKNVIEIDMEDIIEIRTEQFGERR